jgi:hypothetical protein
MAISSAISWAVSWVMPATDDICTMPGRSEADGLATAAFPKGAAIRPSTAKAASALRTTASIEFILTTGPLQRTTWATAWLTGALKCS